MFILLIRDNLDGNLSKFDKLQSLVSYFVIISENRPCTSMRVVSLKSSCCVHHDGLLFFSIRVKGFRYQNFNMAAPSAANSLIGRVHS